MQGFIGNIEQLTLENTNFRKVLYTAHNSQLVLMSIAVNDDIGEEIHQLDQFIRIESGRGKVILDGIEHEIEDDTAIVIPAGTKHNVINTGVSDLKLYTIYSPPEHKDGEIHQTKSDSLVNEKHFDGNTTE